MKKIILSIIAGILVLSIVSCGYSPNFSDSDSNTESNTESNTDSETITVIIDAWDEPFPEYRYSCTTLEEYYLFARENDLSSIEGFIPYESIEYIGEFSSFFVGYWEDEVICCGYGFDNDNIKIELRLSGWYRWKWNYCLDGERIDNFPTEYDIETMPDDMSFIEPWEDRRVDYTVRKVSCMGPIEDAEFKINYNGSVSYLHDRSGALRAILLRHICKNCMLSETTDDFYEVKISFAEGYELKNEEIKKFLYRDTLGDACYTFLLNHSLNGPLKILSYKDNNPYEVKKDA